MHLKFVSISVFCYSLRRNGTPPLFDVLPFEINIENYFLLIGIICTLFVNFPRSSVGWKEASNLWVACSNHARVLFFISLVEFLKCILGANVIDFEIFKIVVVIIFLESCHPWKYCKVSHTTLSGSIFLSKIKCILDGTYLNQPVFHEKEIYSK